MDTYFIWPQKCSDKFPTLYGTLSECIPYLDDVIVFSETFEQHIEHFPRVLQRLKSHGVKPETKEV